MSLPDGTRSDETRPPWTLQPRDRQLADVLTGALARARERQYAGWRVDGAPAGGLAASLPVGGGSLGGAVDVLARRTPLDLRPFLLGRPRRTVGATAQFAMASQVASWLDRTDPTAVDDPEGTDHLAETERLVAWLRDGAREDGFWGVAGAGGPGDGPDATGGSDGDDDPDVTEGNEDPADEGRDEDGAPGADPGPVDVGATSLAVRALVRGVFLDRDHARAARSTGASLVRNPDVLVEARRSSDRLAAGRAVPADVAALGARLLLDLYGHLRESWLLEPAEEILDDVASRQAARGGWTEGRRPLDTYRTGLVVEAFQRHEAVTGRRTYASTLADALHFYQRTLFEPDGAPNAGPADAYPRTARAAAQGVVVFTNEGDYRFARHVLDWTLEHLHAGDGRFHVRKQRLRTKRRGGLARCQAPMAYAIAEYLRRRYIDAGEAVGSRRP